MRKLTGMFTAALLTAVVLVIVAPAPAQAVTVTIIRIDPRLLEGGEIVFDPGAGAVSVPYAILSKNNCVAQARELETILQWSTDDHQLRAFLSIDDPDRFANPDQPNLFWSDVGGERQLSQINAFWMTSRPTVWDIQCDDAGNFLVGLSNP